MYVSNRLGLVVCLAFLFALPMAGGQEETKPADHPCIAKDEPVYGPGDKKVKPPKMDVWPAEEQPEGLKGKVVLEVLVNSEGRVCNVRLLQADDKTAGVKAAKHVADHWKFKAATLDGKAVAVRITVVFAQQVV